MKVQVVIPSRKRSHIIKKCVSLFYDPIVVVYDSEFETYKKVLPDIRVLSVPDTTNRLVGKRQWIMDNIYEESILQVDDDVEGMYCLVGHRSRRIEDKDMIADIIEQTARNCHEAGTVLWSFAHTTLPRECDPKHPITITGHVPGHAMGFITEEFNKYYRFDQRNQTKIDVDISMQVLARHRFIWRDCRFCLNAPDFLGTEGGSAGIRTFDMEQNDIRILQEKYGEKFIHVDHFSRKKNAAQGHKHKHIFVRVRRSSS